ncbi:hypothetical protein GCM10008106_19880 [Mongoliitalea lutea]|uniref:Uncharacterized protein n=1 Tax=Mongoliitalea lutea TaxID=849756 RepID=A0A8J3CWB1_9BACT|nr:hypothetical protein GCM10008106_19880 [Mongoliitalea lutea]
MKKLSFGLFTVFLFVVSGFSTAGDVDPPSISAKTKCTVSSNPSNNVGYCVRFFTSDRCTPRTSGTIGPNCDGTVSVL